MTAVIALVTERQFHYRLTHHTHSRCTITGQSVFDTVGCVI